MNLGLAYVCAHVEDYADFFKDCPDGNLLTAIFSQLKQTRKRPIGTKLIKAFLQPPLEHIDLGGLIIEQGVYPALNKCANLKSLHLQGCFTCLTDTNLELLVRRCRNLKILDVSACRYITDAGLAQVGKHARLTHLSMRYLHRVTPAGVASMLKALGASGLRTLDVSGCLTLTTDPDAWKSLVAMFPDLTIVNTNVLAGEFGEAADPNAK